MLQFPIHSEIHGSKAGKSADKIGNGFGQKDPHHPQASDLGEQDGQGHHNDDFPEQGEENGMA